MSTSPSVPSTPAVTFLASSHNMKTFPKSIKNRVYNTRLYFTGGIKLTYVKARQSFITSDSEIDIGAIGRLMLNHLSLNLHFLGHPYNRETCHEKAYTQFSKIVLFQESTSSQLCIDLKRTAPFPKTKGKINC